MTESEDKSLDVLDEEQKKKVQELLEKDAASGGRRSRYPCLRHRSRLLPRDVLGVGQPWHRRIQRQKIRHVRIGFQFR